MFSFLQHPGLRSTHSISKAEHHAKRASVTGGEITTKSLQSRRNEAIEQSVAEQEVVEPRRQRDTLTLGIQKTASLWHEVAYVDSDAYPSLV